MANRRIFQTLTRQYSSFLSSSIQSLNNLNPILQTLAPIDQIQTSPPKSDLISTNLTHNYRTKFAPTRHFSSNRCDDSDDDEDFEEDDDDDDQKEEGESEDYDNDVVSASNLKREYTLEEKENEASAIGYKVIGQLQQSDRVFKEYEPVFAIIQIGSHQFKVSNGDCIYVERLKFCEVHDKIILNKVLMLGSATQTLIGRPVLPDASVHAMVEEHALDAKVIIFKKKRRKNYRRTNGHRQELTKLRITDIQGIEKPEKPVPVPVKTKKAATEKVEKVAVAA